MSHDIDPTFGGAKRSHTERLTHDLRGALNSVSGYSQLLSRHYPDDERFDRLQHGVDRLCELVEKFEVHKKHSKK